MATPVLNCGIECGVSGPHFTLSGTSSISTTTVRSVGTGTGLRSIRVNPTAGAGDGLFSISSTAVLVARFAIRFASLPGADALVANANGGTDAGLGFKSSDGKLYPAYAGGGVNFGSSGVAITTGQWYVIDLKYDGTGNTVDIRVDGTALTQLSNVAISGNANGIRLGTTTASTTMDAFYDDLLVSATSGDYPLGNGYGLSYIPNADGSHNVAGANDFERSGTGTDITNATTDAYQLIDDRPMPSSSVDYINGIAPPNPTDYVEWQYEDSVESNAPQAVEGLLAVHDAGGAGTNAYSVTLRRNATGSSADIFNGTQNVGSTITYRRAQFTTAPGGATWTTAIFNDLRSRFLVSDASPDPFIDGAMLEVDFPMAFPSVNPQFSQEAQVPQGWHPAIRSQQTFQGFLKSSPLNLGIPERPPPGLDVEHEHDFPNPHGWNAAYRVPAVLRDGFVWPTPIQFGVPPTGPQMPLGYGQENDQPNPQRPDYRVAYQGYVQSRNLLLLPPVQDPFKNYDFPNPVRSQWHIAFQGWTQRSLPYPPPNTMSEARGQTNDQPNPLRPNGWVAFRGHTQNSLPYPPPDTLPIGRGEQQFPNPLTKRHSYDGFVWPTNPNLYPSVVQNPFALTDWPNPIRPQHRYDGFVQSSHRLLQAGPREQGVFDQHDWPNPVLSRWHIAYQGWTQNSLPFPPPNTLPVGRGETLFPNPLTPKWDVAYRGHTQTSLPYPPPNTLPVGRGEQNFPNPIRPRHSYDGFLHEVAQFTLVEPAPPFIKRDVQETPVNWVWLKRHIGYQGWTPIAPYGTIEPVVLPPFKQTDWPNPRWYPFPQILRTYTNTSGGGTGPVGTMPFPPVTAFLDIECYTVTDDTAQYVARIVSSTRIYLSGVLMTQNVAEVVIVPTSGSSLVTSVTVEVII